MTTAEILYTCALGIGIVFVGLICIIFITMIMSGICRMFAKPEGESKPVISAAQMPRKKPVAAPAATNNAPISNKQELVAGICAVIAEELGTDVSNIRVTSFKRL